MAQVPLESPRPFPTSLRPLVARLAGSADRASYTSGPATRRALAEVGALGATTGTVVHLTQQPSTSPSSLGVLAHELTHARQPVSRPRFMLHKPGGAMDADERTARSVGDLFQSGAGDSIAAGVGPGDTPRSSNVLSGLNHRPSSVVGSRVHRAVNSVSDQAGSAVSGLGDRVSATAGGVSAGLVDRLPVGAGSGGGVVDAVTQVARSVAESTVREATETLAHEAGSDAMGGLSDFAGGAAQSVNQWVNPAFAAASGAIDQAGSAATGAIGQAQGVLNQAQGAVSGLAGQATGLAAADLDRIAQALEERLLRQLERRGGRYAGVF